METIIINAEPKKIKAILEFLKAFDVAFEVKKTEKVYNVDVVAEVLKSKQEYKDGKYTAIKTEDLWK